MTKQKLEKIKKNKQIPQNHIVTLNVSSKSTANTTQPTLSPSQQHVQQIEISAVQPQQAIQPQQDLQSQQYYVPPMQNFAPSQQYNPSNWQQTPQTQQHSEPSRKLRKSKRKSKKKSCSRSKENEQDEPFHQKLFKQYVKTQDDLEQAQEKTQKLEQIYDLTQQQQQMMNPMGAQNMNLMNSLGQSQNLYDLNQQQNLLGQSYKQPQSLIRSVQNSLGMVDSNTQRQNTLTQQQRLQLLLAQNNLLSQNQNGLRNMYNQLNGQSNQLGMMSPWGQNLTPQQQQQQLLQAQIQQQLVEQQQATLQNPPYQAQSRRISQRKQEEEDETQQEQDADASNELSVPQEKPAILTEDLEKPHLGSQINAKPSEYVNLTPQRAAQELSNNLRLKSNLPYYQDGNHILDTTVKISENYYKDQFAKRAFEQFKVYLNQQKYKIGMITDITAEKVTSLYAKPDEKSFFRFILHDEDEQSVVFKMLTEDKIIVHYIVKNSRGEILNQVQECNFQVVEYPEEKDLKEALEGNEPKDEKDRMRNMKTEDSIQNFYKTQKSKNLKKMNMRFHRLHRQV